MTSSSATATPAPPTVLLVHGAWHGSWCWTALRAELDAAGVPSTTVDLPSVVGGPGATEQGDGPSPLSGLHDDAAVIRAAAASVVEATGGPVVVVAHSYGAAPAVEALTGLDGVAHLVVVTGFLLDDGESLLRSVGGTPPPWWLASADGSTWAVADPGSTFYNGCPPEVVEESVARLLPQSAASFAESLNSAAWHTVPTTYVIGEHDNALPPEAQEAMAQRAGAVHRLGSGHSPFLSDPAALARVIVATTGR